MTEPKGWLCLACGRRVPLQVETCRCGIPRPAAATLRSITEANQAAASSESVLASPAFRRILLLACFVAAVAAVFVTTYTVFGGRPPDTAGNVRVVARLDEYTKGRDLSVRNTIPTFLTLPGKVGMLAAETPVDPEKPTADYVDYVAAPQEVEPLSESELQKGFCTPSVPLLIRQRYPGAYDDMSDAELEEKVLEKYPEYRDKLCLLPPWISAMPHDIVKYELISQNASLNLMNRARALLWPAGITAAFAIATLSVYSRVRRRG